LSSADREREAITIEPVVSGQQLIASVDDEGGSAVCSSSSGNLFADGAAGDFADLCLTLQHACPSIAADIIAMEYVADGCESMSAIAPRA
jgi:hypothetical protein